MPLTARQRTIHSKNGAKRAASFNKVKPKNFSRKGSTGDFLVTNAPTDLRSIPYPGGAVALVLLVTARILAAFYGHISDCDETYNYWEPLHYLVYGNGLQTWEYSPAYAIRSYTPLWFLATPLKMLSAFLTPVSVFYATRVFLAIQAAIAEFMFYKATCHEFGVQVGRVWLALTLPAAGQWARSAALLPSACSGALAAAAAAAAWRRRYSVAVAVTALNVLWSWPFTALLGVPIAIDMLLLKRRYTEFVNWSLLALIVTLLPAVIIDSWFYSRLVVAPWNIVAYNIFGGNGPELYGVEPWTYYFVNGFLNFNIVWILSLICPVLLPLCSLITSEPPRASFCLPYWLSLLPLYSWLAVFMLQPHKEERFLYPVYSMIVLAGAISLDCIQKMTYAIGSVVLSWRKAGLRHYVHMTSPIMYTVIFIAGVASISRTYSLYNNYHGSMRILQHLPSTEYNGLDVCYGKDWYRSPSSFHLPPGYGMRLVKSEFRGQLPAPFTPYRNATSTVHPYFNDRNEENNSTYLPPSKCHYLVDSDLGTPSPLQPEYHKQTHNWEVVASVKILDAEKSKDKFLRAFYVPVLSAQNNVYANLYLLKNKLVEL